MHSKLRAGEWFNHLLHNVFGSCQYVRAYSNQLRMTTVAPVLPVTIKHVPSHKDTSDCRR